MALLVMDCRASDNKYLHRDFHSSIDNGIRYVGEHFGDSAVRELLKRYTLAYHKPRLDEIRVHGLSAISAYLTELYAREEAADALSCTCTADTLTVTTAYHPGVRYMRSVNETPSRWYVETIRVIYGIFAETAGCDFILQEYNEESGAAKFTFIKRKENLI